MTTTKFWNKLDGLATSKDTSNALPEMADLLHKAGDLPMLILCRRMPGRIHHLYTVFDERNPDATGNHYLICFTSEKQAKKKPPASPAMSDAHEQGPVFTEDEEEPTTGKKRRKRKTKAGTWKAMESGEIAKVPVKKVLAYMKRSKAVGGLVFNPYDEKRSMAITKFLIQY